MTEAPATNTPTLARAWSIARIVAGLAFDAFAVWAVFVVRNWMWFRGPPPDPSGWEQVPESWWRYGSINDFLLYGPDAGNWAANALALAEGRPPDIHRMPVYGWITVAAMKAFDDVVFAGHLVNHFMSALTCVVAYFLGRALGGRAVGFLAAACLALARPLVNSQNLYGVDPTFGLAFVLMATATWMAIRWRWWLAPLAGALAGVCAATHYMGLMFPLPMALLLFMGGRRWWHRLLGPLLAFGAAWGTWTLLMAPYETLTPIVALNIYAEGVQATGVDSDAGGALSFSAAVAEVLAKLEGALPQALQNNLGPVDVGLLPVGALAVLGALGLLGPGLARDPRFRFGWDWRAPIFLIVGLGPLVLLEAARAPERYRWYAWPLVFICLGRGMAVPMAALDRLIQRKLPAWPGGLLGLLLVLFVVFRLQGPMRAVWPGLPNMDEALQDRQVGQAIIERFGSGGQLITGSQTITFYAQRTACPRRMCPSQDQEGALEQCRQIVLEGCDWAGDTLPYLVDRRDIPVPMQQPGELMDQWVAAQLEPVEEIQGTGRVTFLYALPHDVLAEGLTTPQQGSGPPGPP